jgi:hypothetical protein
MSCHQSYYDTEKILISAKPFNQLDNQISELRSMVSINDHLVLMALDRDRVRDEGEGKLYILFSPELVRDLQFSSSDMMKRIEAIAEKIDMLSAEAFDAPK